LNSVKNMLRTFVICCAVDLLRSNLLRSLSANEEGPRLWRGAQFILLMERRKLLRSLSAERNLEPGTSRRWAVISGRC
ncbi:MAG TPA: hypothetical protein PK198_15305, partial [Saprospiraceae bacterium]|nr:hypothetical protein [Saprospiraceae bacterium]